MKKSRTTPRQSLRTLLMVWLLMFAVVPLAFITGYSLVKYEQAIDQELHQRLVGNGREIQVILQDFHRELSTKNRQHAADKALVYYLSANKMSLARELGQRWMRGSITSRLSIFNREGRLEVALVNEAGGDIVRQSQLEGSDVYLSEDFLRQAEGKGPQSLVDFSGSGSSSSVDLITFSAIRANKGSVVGYIEEIIRVDENFILGLKRRLNLELAFISKDGAKIVSSHEDLTHYRQGFFLDKYNEAKESIFEINIRNIPFGMLIDYVDWGGEKFYIAIGASKQMATEVLKEVNYAFFTVVGAVIFLLIILSFIFSKIMLQPLNTLVEFVQNVDFDNPPEAIPRGPNNELGILTESFNEMSQRVYTAQAELKENIKKVETANVEIREAQSKLVHAAKMASLGQLVAGVAHELNNPISFIYSNMDHLRDYSNKLVGLINTAEKNPSALAAEKEKIEFNYIVQDMPKLIQSCEDGAKRTRDIVIGLRNFSRLDEAKIKEIDIHEAIESTLALLSSEFKTRIKVIKNYSELPKITCYPSQLNQVFMNILSNAAQAIPGQGEVTITTRKKNDTKIEISIRDNGAGMSESVQEKIFDPFFTTKDVNSGTGLGMSISYGIIKNHNGDIRVSSKLGKGTEFFITLPVHL